MSSLLNRAINALPFELHIPGYQFFGLGTHLEKRLARSYRGINPLVAACCEHDIAYSPSNDFAERHVTDNILATKARKHIAARISIRRESCSSCLDGYESQEKIGMDLKTKKKKKVKQILPVAKRVSYQSYRCWGFSVHWPAERQESRKW